MGRSVGRMTGFANVTMFRDRHGKPRYRWRQKGCKTVYLPGLPGSSEFAEAYAAATQGQAKLVIGEGKTKPGTINALAVAIYASLEWGALSPATQTTYKGIIERLRTAYGDLTVRSLSAGAILKMRDKKVDAPTAANNLVKVLRWMLEFAVARQWRADNPAVGIKPIKVKSDGFHTWAEGEVRQFEARWAVGTKPRLALDLFLYTIQRSGDVRRMGRQHIKEGRLEFVQEKTGAALSLPIVPALAASLALVPETQMLFVATGSGAPYTAKGFGNWFKDACVSAGLPHCTAHGLRKTGATRLADAGYSEAVIMAWTGHQTTKEIQRYTRARNQKTLADSAVAGPESEQQMATESDGLANTAAKAL